MAFTKKIWVNVPDPSNPPSIPEGQDELARFDADNMNRIEEGIEEAFDRVSSLSKEDIDLGNVPNVTTNDQTPTYEESTDLTTLTSGEKLRTAFGKIKKAISELISHLGNNSNPHNVTKEQIGLGRVVIKDDDVAIGRGASSKDNSVAIGLAAEAHQGGGAAGYCATTTDGGCAVGYGTRSNAGGAVGYQAIAEHGGAVGNGAEAGSGFSGGMIAKVKTLNDGSYINAIQLGAGTNENERTLQVYDYKLMDANGVIPAERLPQSSQGYKLIKTQNISWNFTSTGQMKKQEQITGIDFTAYDQYKVIFKGTMNYTQTASGTSSLYLGYTPTEAPAGNTTGAISSVEFKSPINVPIAVTFKGEEITITKKRGTSYSYSNTGILTDNSTMLSSSIAWTTDKLWFWLYTAAQATISVSGTVSVYGKVN